MGDNFYAKLAQLLNDEALLADEFQHQPGRWEQRHFINARVQSHFAGESCEYWLEKLKEHRIPAAPVNDFAHALGDPQVLARNMQVTVPLHNGESVKQPGNPIKLSQTYQDRYTAPPKAGEHSAGVLQRMLGLTGDEIDALVAQGIVAASDD